MYAASLGLTGGVSGRLRPSCLRPCEEANATQQHPRTTTTEPPNAPALRRHLEKLLVIRDHTTNSDSADITIRRPASTSIAVHSLPPELLCLIASFLIPDAFTSHLGPLLPASQVSRAWRQALISCPSLWSTISINSFSSRLCLSRRNPQGALCILNTMLSRSKSIGLDVDFQWHSPPSFLNVNGFRSWGEALLTVLVAHSPRWRRVRIRLGDEEGQRHALAHVKGRLDMLTELSFSAYGFGRRFDEKALDMWVEAPHLSAVRLDDVEYSFSSPDPSPSPSAASPSDSEPFQTKPLIQFPYHQLSSYTEGYRVTSASPLLSIAAGSLRECTLIGSSYSLPGMLTMSNLTALNFTLSSFNTSCILSHLILPNLQSLKLTNESLLFFAPTDMFSVMSSLFIRSQCNLEELSIVGPSLLSSDEGLQNVLHTLRSSLRKLTIDDRKLFYPLISHLSNTADMRVLSHLTIRGPSPSCADDDVRILSNLMQLQHRRSRQRDQPAGLKEVVYKASTGVYASDALVLRLCASAEVSVGAL